LDTSYVSIEDFKKLDIRVGTVVRVERIRRTEKLYKMVIDLGPLGTKQTVASLVGHYTPEQLLQRKIIFLANLKPVKFSGEISEDMILTADQEHMVSLLTVDQDVPDGVRVV
jgi:methionyl-tRNA synthetase